jgi:hypothetical protein
VQILEKMSKRAREPEYQFPGEIWALLLMYQPLLTVKYSLINKEFWRIVNRFIVTSGDEWVERLMRELHGAWCKWVEKNKKTRVLRSAFEEEYRAGDIVFYFTTPLGKTISGQPEWRLGVFSTEGIERGAVKPKD